MTSSAPTGRVPGLDALGVAVPAGLRAWALAVMAWQVVGLAGTLALALPSGGFHRFVEWLMIGLTFTNLFGGLGSGVVLALRRMSVQRPRVLRWSIAIAGVAAAVVVAAAVSIGVGRRVCRADGFVVDRLHLLMVSVDLVLLAAVTLGAAVIVIYSRLSADLARRHQEQARLERLQLETQLSLLQAKVNPHFLFNTLSTMLELVRSDPSRVESMILNLSDIYRKVLTWPETARVSLEEEFELVRQYLEIEAIRMGARLTYRCDLDPDLRRLEVPPLMVEILAENAVRHGVAPRASGGMVSVVAHRRDGRAVITVEDDGVGPGEQTEGGTGFGLFSVRQRLSLVYGEHAALVVEPRPGGGTRAIIQVPHGY